MAYFRFECNGVGIYEEVQRQCPQGDALRSGQPDGSWLNRVGEQYPGAISFWTFKGMQKYHSSQLCNWHMSVVEGDLKLAVATSVENPLYEDEFQVIALADQFKMSKTIRCEYSGPRPYRVQLDSRPEMIRSESSLLQFSRFAWYPQSDETFSFGASLAASVGLRRHAVNIGYLPPRTRSSWPHAHKVEEEMVMVLEGSVQYWVDGEAYRANPGDVIFFAAGGGEAHTVINPGPDTAKILVQGEQDKEEDYLTYPLHPEREAEIREKGFFWDDHPGYQVGEHDGGFDGADSKQPVPNFMLSTQSMEFQAMGNPDDDDKVFYWDRDISRQLKTDRLALHHVKLPSGFRSSMPHAESAEEEFVYVLKGSAIAWIDGHRYPLKPKDCVGFPSGTGIHHTLINESGEDCEFLVCGERSKANNLCAFVLNPEFESECPIWWANPPQREMGPDSPMPKS